MLSYAHQFIKIKQVLISTRLISETTPGPPIFISFLKKVDHYLSAVEVLKKSIE